ncbi:MAG: alpha-amylase family glycosyl hydrolase [Anaerolineaceae bacterium]|nr:alpha-amylase family glycosyl hydrolase [Anaerolineaceae bacterium]
MLETKDISRLLTAIYGSQTAGAILAQLLDLAARYEGRLPRPRSTGLSQKDAFLITYPDQLHEPGTAPLASLARFCSQRLREITPCIHILPFFPYSSDDGFSVIDYRLVDPQDGTWHDIRKLQQSFRVMADGVFNHISAESSWFQAFLKDDPAYKDFFIVIADSPDLSQVVRPRALPLLTRFETPSGPKQVWTTFSTDQIDLNFKNPQVLLEILDILLFYVSQGAEFIRLDAIAYLWKEIGTSCIHLPQTHQVIQLFRSVLNQLAPHVSLITETNVPHTENLSYFGDGHNEAQLVYNFALPPLVLDAIRQGRGSTLSEWAGRLVLPSSEVTFYNFLASHDGIGVNPVRGILPEQDITALVEQTLHHGGFVSYKNNPDGSKSPYELNINYFDALSDPSGQEPLALQVERAAATHAVLLSLAGVPAIYFHSLFGSRGWREGALKSGHNRTINRQKLDRLELEGQLADPQSLRSQVFNKLSHLIQVRAASPAFNPYGAQQVLACGDPFFALLRRSSDGRQQVLCLINLSAQAQIARLPSAYRLGQELIGGTPQFQDTAGSIHLQPYQACWFQLLP